MSALIKTEDINQNTRVISLNRPEAKNALTGDMYLQLEEELKQADNASHIRAIILYGNQDCFTAGNDISDFISTPPTGEDSPPFRFLRTLNKTKKPVIAAVNGFAIGIGTTMLLHCDLAYASKTAIFSTPFVDLGCSPEGASSLLFNEIMGPRKAAQLLLLCDKFNADQALEAGLISAISEDDDALVDAKEAALTISKKAPGAVQQTKALIKEHKLQTIDLTIVHEARLFAERLKTPEAIEAFSAFKEKRKPDFSRF